MGQLLAVALLARAAVSLSARVVVPAVPGYYGRPYGYGYGPPHRHRPPPHHRPYW